MRLRVKELARRLLGRDRVSYIRSFIDHWTMRPKRTDEVVKSLRLGKEAIERREFAAALELFQRATDSGLVDSEGNYGWGVAALQLGRTGEALNALHRALDAEPPHPEAALKLAELTLIDHDDAGALELYGRALKIAPNYAEAYLGRGKVEARLGREVEALESFRRAFEINPEYPEAGLRLAEWTLANGSVVEALEI
jgi:tetratricopeptide (TPR) repeat protein